MRAETKSILAQTRSQQILPGGGGIALIEDQINHFEHGRQTKDKLDPARNLKRLAEVGEAQKPGPILQQNWKRHTGQVIDSVESSSRIKRTFN